MAYYYERYESIANEVHNGIFFSAASKVFKTNFQGKSVLGYCTAINRSQIGMYSTFGSFSYVVDTLVGNYSSIGSRVSIGPFSHPINDFSINEIIFRNTQQFFGETILDDDSDFYASNKKLSTKLGPDCYIGDNAIILRGVELPVGCVVGAGAVVTKTISEPYSIIVGNPGRVKSQRFCQDSINKLLETNWWTLDLKSLKKMMPELRKIIEITKHS